MLGSVGASIVCVSIAAAGILASSSLFWSLPTAVLGGMSAAAGIAAVNCFANLAGFFSPAIVGWLNDLTGKVDSRPHLYLGRCRGRAQCLVFFVPARRSIAEPNSFKETRQMSTDGHPGCVACRARLPYPPQRAAHGRSAGPGLYRPGARHRRRARRRLLRRDALPRRRSRLGGAATASCCRTATMRSRCTPRCSKPASCPQKNSRPTAATTAVCRCPAWRATRRAWRCRAARSVRG